MADISKLKIDGTSYDIKDSGARTAIQSISNSIAGGVHFRGVSTTAITDMGTEKPTISNSQITANNGDIVIYETQEFIYSTSDNKWHKLGDRIGLGTLAYKSSASGSVSVSSGQITISGDISLPGDDLAHNLILNSDAKTAKFTPAGTITAGATGNVTVATGGSNTSSAVTLSGGSTKKYKTESIPVYPATLTTHDTPTLKKSNIGSASGWSAGTMFAASYNSSDESLNFTSGTAPTLTVSTVSVGTDLTAGASQSVVQAGGGSKITVVTGTEATGSQEGITVATALHTGGTAAAQSFTPTTTKLSFTGTENSGVSIAGAVVDGTINIPAASRTVQFASTPTTITSTGTVTVY